MKEDFKEVSYRFGMIVLIAASCISLIAGIAESLDGRPGNRGCEYKSVAAYFPVHYVTCELLRPRFKQ